MMAQKASAVENALNCALAQSEGLSALLESTLSIALPENTRVICEEIAELRKEQEIVRRLTNRRQEGALAE